MLVTLLVDLPWGAKTTINTCDPLSRTIRLNTFIDVLLDFNFLYNPLD